MIGCSRVGAHIHAAYILDVRDGLFLLLSSRNAKPHLWPNGGKASNICGRTGCMGHMHEMVMVTWIARSRHGRLSSRSGRITPSMNSCPRGATPGDVARALLRKKDSPSDA